MTTPGSADPTRPRKPDSASGARLNAGPGGMVPGRKIGPYRITGEAGKGGMGVVYRAHDTALDRDVAIKILPAHLSTDEEFIRRFVREARSAARLDHPAVVQIYQAGRMVVEGNSGPCFIAMQYFDGRPLSDLIASEGRLPPQRALDIAKQVAEGLAAAHAAGVVHRDIKSSNILVGEGDRVKVTDFGLAVCLERTGRTRITETGAYLGTPEYSSPEQCEGTDLDGRTDIYSLGIVLYEMLTGRVPFSAPTPIKLFDRIVREAPEPVSRAVPGLPREVSAVVDRMLAKRRADRYGSAEELLSALRRARVALGTWRRGPGTGGRRAISTRIWRAGRSGAFAATAAAVGLLLSVGAIGLYLHFAKEPGTGDPRPRPPDAVAPPAPVGDEVGVAIFDLTDRTGSADFAWVSNGVPQMLVAELTRCQGLTVYSREKAAEALRAAGSQDVAEAARRMGARLAVSGIVLADRGGLRIDLTVQDVTTGRVAAAVKEQGSGDRIIEMVDQLGQKLRSSFDELVALRRGQRLAAASLPGVEECLFVAVADTPAARKRLSPTDDSAKAAPGNGPAGHGGVEAKEGGPTSANGFLSRGGRAEESASGSDRKNASDLAEDQSVAKKQDKDLSGASGGGRRSGWVPDVAPEAPGRPQYGASVLPPPSAAPSPKPSATAAPRAPEPSPVRDSRAEQKKAKQEAFRRELNKSTESVGAAPVELTLAAKAGSAGGTGVSADRSRRSEALRHFFTGQRILELARQRPLTRADYHAALAEFALANGLAPDLAGLDEAVRRANAGLDAAGGR